MIERVDKPIVHILHDVIKLLRQYDVLTIKDDAIKQFIKMVGFKDLTNAKTEIDKLINYIGEGGEITKDDVMKVCTREIQTDIFALSNAIIECNKEKAVSVYLDFVGILLVAAVELQLAVS